MFKTLIPFLPSVCRHSPFRQHKTKDKHEIDRLTLTYVSMIENGVFLLRETLRPLGNCKRLLKTFMYGLANIIIIRLVGRRISRNVFWRNEVTTRRSPQQRCPQQTWVQRLRVSLPFSFFNLLSLRNRYRSIFEKALNECSGVRKIWSLENRKTPKRERH